MVGELNQLRGLCATLPDVSNFRSNPVRQQQAQRICQKLSAIPLQEPARIQLTILAWVKLSLFLRTYNIS
jgi:hypothetical protein